MTDDLHNWPIWFKCKDKSPPEYHFVLVCGFTGTSEPSPISIARWDKKKWELICDADQCNACASGDLFWGIDPEDISHWTYLPKPPE